MNRKFDRHTPDPLPSRRMLTRDIVVAPVADTRKFCGPVKDQGGEGACTAHAGTEAFEWIDRAYFKNSRIYSPQYTYAKELIAQGDFPNDEGSDGTTLCGTLIVNGCCELSLFPYVSGQIVRPTAAQDLDAAKHTLGSFHGLTGSKTALSILGDPTPWPVLVGFTVYESFESDQVAKTGVYDPNLGAESVLGGHEVLMVGYDVGETPTLRPSGSKPSALIMNSWGTGWGLSGFVWMALSVLDASDTDLKIAHSGGPWK
jgi:hypothetical protein